MSGPNIVAILLGLVVFLVACGGTTPPETAEALPTSTPVQVEQTSEGKACLSPRGVPRAMARMRKGRRLLPHYQGTRK